MFSYKYKWKLKRAKTEEEVKKIYEQKWQEKDKIIEDFEQKRFEKHVNGPVRYFARRTIWAEELAKRANEKYGFEVKIPMDSEVFFVTTFGSTGMKEEQVIQEVLKRVGAMIEIEKMLEDEDTMNEFLISRGMSPSGRSKAS